MHTPADTDATIDKKTDVLADDLANVRLAPSVLAPAACRLAEIHLFDWGGSPEGWTLGVLGREYARRGGGKTVTRCEIGPWARLL